MISTATHPAERQATHLPPQDLTAERSVIASAMLEEAFLEEVTDFLKPEHFYSDVNRMLYEAILHLRDKLTRIDVVTLADELSKRGQLDDIGGTHYLFEVMETVPHAAHIKHYADIVRDKWILRSLTSVCTSVLGHCYESGGETNDILEDAERGIFEIMESQNGSDQLNMQDIMVQTLDRISLRTGTEGALSGLSTGFPDLDNQTNGFQKTELVIIAARPSMGKTAFICNIAEWVADAGKTATLIFSLEQSKLELAERLLCIRARLDGHKVRKGQLEPFERHSLLEASTQLSHLPLFIDDKPGRTISQISAICRRMKRRNNLGLVIIDYLQLIEPEDKRANREQQIAQITRRLKGIAKELDVPLIALSQLNRGVDLREDKRPRLADLRESGAIEQDADIVMFLHRPEAYNPEDRPGLAEVIVAKHRSGPTGLINLEWRKHSMRFCSMEAQASF